MDTPCWQLYYFLICAWHVNTSMTGLVRMTCLCQCASWPCGCLACQKICNRTKIRTRTKTACIEMNVRQHAISVESQHAKTFKTVCCIKSYFLIWHPSLLGCLVAATVCLLAINRWQYTQQVLLVQDRHLTQSASSTEISNLLGISNKLN